MARIIANYLPQYHTIPENDAWWGKGYTDWVAVKKTKPLYEGHIQPKKPLSDYYYDLSNIESIKWQANLANKYGVYGFGIYHYWFSSKQILLQKPAELIRDNSDIDIHYMFIWDNSTWKRTWSNVKGPTNDWAPLYENNVQQGSGVLAELIYGTEQDWKIHFDYLNSFFRDKRYIKVEGKPLFAIFNQSADPYVIKSMCDYWNELAVAAGYPGLEIIGRTNSKKIYPLEGRFTYQPTWDGWTWQSQFERVTNKIKEDIIFKNKLKTYSYDWIWKRIIKNAKKFKNQYVYLSGFVSYDDTPRRGMNGRVVTGGTPQKFECYLSNLLKISNDNNMKYLFLTAWNEWGEGAYLEPDEENGYAYLEALKRAIDSVDTEKI